MGLLEDLIAFVNKFFTDSFDTINPSITDFTIPDLAIAIFWSFSLSFIIAITYRGTHDGLSYSKSFTQSLIHLGFITAALMMIIGSSIVRAFTLIGALSIIRFRNAIKDTRDTVFIFYVIIIGMASGSKFYLIAIVFTIVGCSIIFLMKYTDFGDLYISQDLLEFNFPRDSDFEQEFASVFGKYLSSYSLLSIDTVNDLTNRFSLIVSIKGRKKPLFLSKAFKKSSQLQDISTKSSFLDEIQHNSKTSDVKFIESSNFAEI